MVLECRENVSNILQFLCPVIDHSDLLLDLCEVIVLIFDHGFKLHAFDLEFVDAVVHLGQFTVDFFSVVEHVAVVHGALLVQDVLVVFDLLAQPVCCIDE